MRSLEESSLGEKCRNCCKCEFISFMNEHTCSGNSLSPAVIALMQARIISPVRSRTPVRGTGFSLLFSNCENYKYNWNERDKLLYFYIHEYSILHIKRGKISHPDCEKYVIINSRQDVQ